jgi:hypothetical protein
LAEEISQCPLASSRQDIVDDRARVRFLAACSIMMRRVVTFSHDTVRPVGIGQLPQPTEYWEEPEYNDKMHEKCGVGLCILGCFVDYYAKAKPTYISTTKQKKTYVH